MHDLILTLHYLGLFMGGAPGIGLLVIGAAIAAAPDEQKPGLVRVVPTFKLVGKTGIGLLLVTGLAMLWMRGAWDSMSLWFAIKMIAFVALVGGVIMADKLGAKAVQGDAEAAGKVRQIGFTNLVSFAVVVFTAVLAFS